MGVVYNATQLSLDRVVALKVLASELSNDPGFRARFQREGQVQARLDHLNIVTVYEAGPSEHGLFLAMRKIEGPTLKDLILSGQLDPRRSLRLLAQVAQALDTAHEAGLIHRDIKPQNVLIGRGDHAYLCDFGLIKSPDDDNLTGTGQFMGTIDYVAPEQIQGLPATGAADVYALTAVLYECLTRRVPYDLATEAAKLYAHVTQAPPKVTEVAPDLPAALDDVIARGMAKDPTSRFPSATELIQQASRATGAIPAPVSAASQPTQITGAVTADMGGGQATRATGIETVASLAAVAAGAPAAATRTSPAIPPAAATSVSAPAAATVVRRGNFMPVAVVLAVVAVAAGFLAGHSGGGKSSKVFPSSASVGPVQLRYPSAWQLGGTAAAVPGLTFRDQLTLASPPAGTGTLVAGVIDGAGGPTLLPASLKSRLVSTLPAGEPVMLGKTQAYRYLGLQVKGLAGELTAFVVPTSGGVVGIACAPGPKPASPVANDCGPVAATLRLVGVTAFPLGPSRDYAALLTTTFNRLRSSVAGPAAKLNAAGTQAAQAAAADQLALAYTGAATTLTRATVTPVLRDAQAALTSALGRLGTGYSAAARGARAGSAAGFGAAAAQIRSASGALDGAVRSLAALGYSVRR